MNLNILRIEQYDSDHEISHIRRQLKDHVDEIAYRNLGERSDWLLVPPTVPLCIHNSALERLAAMGVKQPLPSCVEIVNRNLADIDVTEAWHRNTCDDIHWGTQLNAAFECEEDLPSGTFTYRLAVSQNRILVWCE